MQTLIDLARDFWNQLLDIMEDLGDWVIYVFEPNSGVWPKIILGVLFFALVSLIVTRASKAK